MVNLFYLRVDSGGFSCTSKLNAPTMIKFHAISSWPISKSFDWLLLSMLLVLFKIKWRPYMLTSFTFLYLVIICPDHGLRTPNEAFFHWDPELLGLDRQNVQILGHLWYFRPIYQHPFWYSEFLVHIFHYWTIIFTKK